MNLQFNDSIIKIDCGIKFNIKDDFCEIYTSFLFKSENEYSKMARESPNIFYVSIYIPLRGRVNRKLALIIKSNIDRKKENIISESLKNKEETIDFSELKKTASKINYNLKCICSSMITLQDNK